MMNRRIEKFSLAPNLLRVVCTPDGKVQEPSCMVDFVPGYNAYCEVITDFIDDNEVDFFLNGRHLFKQLDWDLQEHDVTRYTVLNGKPKIVMKRTVDGERSFVENAEVVKTGVAFGGNIRFKVEADECLFGLGQHERGYYNHRDMTEYLYQNNMKIPMPVLVSSKGYALFFDCTGLMTYEEKNGVVTISFDTVDQIDYYVITGETMDEIIAGLRKLTGKAVLLPKWAYGYVQSKERYCDQDEMVETVKEFQKRGIPLGCLVLDWKSWEEGKWGNKIMDKSRFPDFKAAVDEMHRMGAAVMVSVWPNCHQGCENNQEFTEAGKLLCDCSTYDAFDPEARDIYWNQCMKEFVPDGVDAWWCDSTEPFTPDWNGSEKLPEEVRYQKACERLNRFLDAKQSNIFALMHAKGIYEHQRAAVKEKRVANLTRSGSPSIQKYGVILWSGDIAATWDCMRRQIAEGMNMALSGIPYWTLDIGAFFVGGVKCSRIWSGNPDADPLWFWQGDFDEGVNDLGYRELYTRWLQMGAFLPVMRSHGTDTPREPWQFGEPGTVYYDTIVKYIKLRYRLLPYVYSLAGKTCREGYTMMRGLIFEFPEDKKAVRTSDQFMLGNAFMACPVTEPMEYGPNGAKLQKECVRKVYLPEGALWYDYETGEVLDGGQTIEADAPIEKMPLYVRSGSIVPVSLDGSGEPQGVEIYAGADGSFGLYCDNGKDYSYENGDYSIIPMKWDDSGKTFTLGHVTGNYGHPKHFTVLLHTADGVQEQKMDYTGKEVSIQF